MNILVTMAAIAFTLGIGGVEVWTVTDPAEGFVHAPHEVVEVIVEQPAQCVTADITWVDGYPMLANSLDRTYTGGLEQGMIRMSMVGSYVWVAVGYVGNQPPSSIDMVSWSIPVVEGDEQVTACLP